ncbi:MAG: polysaccharide deacetylase family protein [Bacillota bacterium]|nr:polysaccharide deacetylase family protein [Bacillota bacterium]
MRIKHAVKNVFLIFLTAVFLITPGMRVSAAKNVVFTVVNDRFLDLNDSTMPFEKGGKYYVPYSVFLSGFGGLKAYYSPEEQVLVFYDKEKIISFDIGHGYAYDQQMRTYGESAYSKGGTVFIPLSFVCSTWGFYYSVIPSSKGTVVRISRESSSLSDSMLLNIGETVMSSLLEKYGNKTPPETPGKPNGGETPVISEARKTVYLTFDAAPTEATAKILRSLSRYRYPATFFCAGDKMEAGDDIIRQIVISGHSVGLNAVSAAQDGKAGGAEKIIRQLRCVEGGEHFGDGRLGCVQCRILPALYSTVHDRQRQ